MKLKQLTKLTVAMTLVLSTAAWSTNGDSPSELAENLNTDNPTLTNADNQAVAEQPVPRTLLRLFQFRWRLTMFESIRERPE